MHKRFPRRQVVGRVALLAGLALALYIVLPQFGGLENSWQAVLHARRELLGLAVGCQAATFLVSTLTYQLLALRPLRFWPTFAVEISCGLAGKLLPAGLGSLGLNAAYLHKNRHSAAQAATVVGVNNLVGFMGYAIILVFSALLLGVRAPHIHVSSEVYWGVLGLALVAGISGYFFRHRLRTQLTRTVHDVRTSLYTYRGRPLHLLGALAMALCTPLLFTIIIWSCAHALGYELSVADAFAAFSAGLIAATATPTPGGVVGAEAGLTAALIAYGLTAPHALVVALVYRFITYWLPMAPGALALLLARKRYV